MNRKWWKIGLLGLLTALCTVTATACADCIEIFTGEDEEEKELLQDAEGLEYELSEDGESYALVGMGTFTGKQLRIPATFEGLPVAAVGRLDPAPHESDEIGKANLTSVHIPNTVTYIGDYAFGGCKELKTITFEEDSRLVEIGKGAFAGCPWTTCHLPDSLKKVGASAFYQDGTYSNYESYEEGYYVGNSENPYMVLVGLKEGAEESGTITLHKDTKIISDGGMFKDCVLHTVDLGESLITIGDEAFYDCKYLREVTLPDTLLWVGEMAFSNCISLAEADLPASVNYLGYSAFSGCSALTEMAIPDGVKELYDTFMDCTNLRALDFGKGVEYLYAPFARTPLLTEVTLPASVKTIASWDWEHNVQKVYFEGSVDEWAEIEFGDIGGGASVTEDLEMLYAKGEPVTELTLTEAKKVSPFAFYGYLGLTSVTLLGDIEEVGTSAFLGCTNLTKLTVGDGVRSLGETCFARCENLSEVSISGKVRSFANDAFSGCDKAITSADGGDYVGDWVIRMDGERLREGTVGIANGAAYGVTYLTTVSIPYTVQTIGAEAFYGCEKLATVRFSSAGQLSYIGDFAFAKCVALTEVSLPSSLKNISSGMFRGCENLARVVIPFGVEKVDLMMATGCPKVTKIHIPASVTEIDRGNFIDSLTGIEELTVSDENARYHSVGNCIIETATKTLVAGCGNSVIPSDGSVEIIGAEAFSSNGDLTAIVIPSAVKRIEDGAFSFCKNLQRVTTFDGLTEIGASAFAGCSSLTEIDLPNSLTTIGEYAFSGCEKLSEVTIPDKVTALSNEAFSGCIALKEVRFGQNSTLESIGYGVFTGSELLRSLKIPASVSYIHAGMIENCVNLRYIEFENPTGWWYGGNLTATAGKLDFTEDSEKNADYFTEEEYAGRYWRRR